MFQLDTARPSVIYQRSTGRLMRPSDRMIATRGLGEVDGFMDVLKNFGSGIVKFSTAGLYDPSKNRFYVPFSSGQVRNFAQGFTNTSTLGLVKTDKFFGSQTMKTIGTVVGAVAAGATAYYGGSALMSKFGGSAGPMAPGAAGSPVYGPPSPVTTGSMFSSLPSLSTVKTTMDVLNMGSKIVGGATGGPQLPPAGSSGAPIIIMTGDNPQPQIGPQLGPVAQPPYSYGYDPSMAGGMMPSGVMMPGGGGGGGGGIGPPGSEYAGMQQDGGQMISQEEGMGTGTKVALVAGVGVLAYLMFAK